MCDIYTDYCKVCGTPIEMHLGDWETPREEIEVYCMEHFPIPYEKECWGWVKWEVPRKSWRKEWVEKHPDVPKRIVVVSLTERAWNNRDDNHPNACPMKTLHGY